MRELNKVFPISDVVFNLVCDKQTQNDEKRVFMALANYDHIFSLQSLTTTEFELIMKPLDIGRKAGEAKDGTIKYVIQWPNSYFFAEGLYDKEKSLGLKNRALTSFQRTTILPMWRDKYAKHV